MLACRPVEWPTTGPLAGHPPSIIYPGAIATKCDDCGIEVYLGPKQQGVKGLEPNMPVICFDCVSKYTDEIQIVNLGNPHLPGGPNDAQGDGA